jgi:hypothetical protein
MRLTAAQQVRLINQEASQAERRRFESGHPLFVQTWNLLRLKRSSRWVLLGSTPGRDRGCQEMPYELAFDPEARREWQT